MNSETVSKPAELVILVDDEDREIGRMEKMRAHREGKLHRAFSVFIFNGANEMLLQRRAAGKYHSPGLWSNACCSHPRPGESVLQAAHRRLSEEMGFDCDLNPEFSFKYRAELNHGMCEHELDHVLSGEFSGVPILNADEVAAYRYSPILEISAELEANPERFTAWFKICYAQVLARRRESGADAG